MPWQNVQTRKTTALDTVFEVRCEFTDLAEFATVPFVYSAERVVNDAAGRLAFKTAANAAVEAERTKRQASKTKEDQFLAFLNAP